MEKDSFPHILLACRYTNLFFPLHRLVQLSLFHMSLGAIAHFLQLIKTSQSITTLVKQKRQEALHAFAYCPARALHAILAGKQLLRRPLQDGRLAMFFMSKRRSQLFKKHCRLSGFKSILCCFSKFALPRC